MLSLINYVKRLLSLINDLRRHWITIDIKEKHVNAILRRIYDTVEALILLLLLLFPIVKRSDFILIVDVRTHLQPYCLSDVNSVRLVSHQSKSDILCVWPSAGDVSKISSNCDQANYLKKHILSVWLANERKPKITEHLWMFKRFR